MSTLVLIAFTALLFHPGLADNVKVRDFRECSLLQVRRARMNGTSGIWSNLAIEDAIEDAEEKPKFKFGRSTRVEQGKKARQHHNAVNNVKVFTEAKDICSLDPTSKFQRLPLKHVCHQDCPFSQGLAGDPCRKVCVVAQNCSQFHPARSFADPRSHRCEATCGDLPEELIVGCKKCASAGVCAECQIGFHLSGDGRQCIDEMASFWKTIQWSLLPVVVILVIYLILLSRRPSINSEVLNYALVHRDRRRVWEERDNGFFQYEFLNTPLGATDVTGQGVMLYFGFLTFAITMAGVLLCGVYLGYRATGLHETPESLHDCSTETKPEKGDFQSGWAMFKYMVAVYTSVLIGSIIFGWYQANLSARWDEQNSTHEDYAVLVEGLPEDATDPEELRVFFQDALNDGMSRLNSTVPEQTANAGSSKIVGVSIAYDYNEHQDLIEDSLRDWVDELEDKKEPRGWLSHPDENQEAPVQENKRTCGLGSILSLQFLDYLFWGSCTEEPPQTLQKPEERANEVRELLGSLPCSGSAFVVVSIPSAQSVLLDVWSDIPPLFRGTIPLSVRDVSSEPPSLIWENFSEMNFHPRIIMGVLVTLATIALWLGLYLPYAMFYSNYMSVPGAQPSAFGDTLLGLLIAMGNAIVAIVVDTVTKWAGFRQKDRRDITILSMAFMATLLNTGCDIWIVMLMAKGAQLGDAFHDKSHGFDHVVTEQLMALIVPGYLILPYLVTPLFEHVLPYVMGRWYVRSRKATLRQAEDCLQCPEFDICWRYSDTLNNFTICLVMLMFATPKSATVMMWLIGFLALIYVIDGYKLLRQTSQTFYTTPRLDNAAQLWWSVPTGLLAVVTVWWACKVGLLPVEWALQLCLTGFAVHVLLYIGLRHIARKYLVRPAADESTPYNTMCDTLWAKGKTWSYFNTNPIFCLRSKYLPNCREAGSRLYPCVPYVPGKVFLQEGVPMHFTHRSFSFKTAFLRKKAEETPRDALAK